MTPGTSALGAVVAAILFGPAFAAMMTAWLALVRRRDRDATGDLDRDDEARMVHAARTGRLPDDRALDDPMLALIDRRRRQNRSALILNPPLFSGLILISITTIRSSGNDWWWAFAAYCLAMIAVSTHQAIRNIRRLDRLRVAIIARSGESRP
ncbi:hypothetical protein [Spirillospora sp. NPDC029432]|uniref:hypothetical protein n=1 Tax=Spirillospora sp. NPDC029432 TaxID=3154599 RepID=UPI003452E193